MVLILSTLLSGILQERVPKAKHIAFSFNYLDLIRSNSNCYPLRPAHLKVERRSFLSMVLSWRRETRSLRIAGRDSHGANLFSAAREISRCRVKFWSRASWSKVGTMIADTIFYDLLK